MIQCLSVYTCEIDDQDKAFGDIHRQLAEGITLRENTVGIVMCHCEFVLSGTAQYICGKLPFDVLGVTTSSQAINGIAEKMVFTLFVMTADDVFFRAGVTESFSTEVYAATQKAYEKASLGMTEQPRLALVFPPLLLENAGDIYPNVWSELLNSTPVFGTIAIDDTVSFNSSETLFNDKSYKDAMPFVLCYGNITPRFMVTTLPDSNAMPYQGEVTKADGPYIHEINGMNAYTYFEERGLAKDGLPTDRFLFVPFMIDLIHRADYDGIPVMRVLTTFTPDGSAVFRGNVGEKSIFTLSKCTEEDVISSTTEAIASINSMDGINGMLSFSCIIRQMALATDTRRELFTFSNGIQSHIPFMAGYAGGEICPTSIKKEKAANRFHNYSLITLLV